MKRIISIVTVAVMLLTLATGCKKAETKKRIPLEGSWKLTDFQMTWSEKANTTEITEWRNAMKDIMGEDATDEELFDGYLYDARQNMVDLVYTFNEDGTGNFVLNGTATCPITWTLSGTALHTEEAGTPREFFYDGYVLYAVDENIPVKTQNVFTKVEP